MQPDGLDTETLQRNFARDGFAVLPKSVPLELALRAREIVDAALAVEVPSGQPLPPTGHSRRSSPLYPGRIDLAGAQFEGRSVGAHPAIGELLTGGPLLSLLREFIGGAEFTFERKDGSRGAPVAPGGTAMGGVTIVFPCVHPPPSRVGCLGYPMNEIPEIVLADGRKGGPWMGHLDGACKTLKRSACRSFDSLLWQQIDLLIQKAFVRSRHVEWWCRCPTGEGRSFRRVACSDGVQQLRAGTWWRRQSWGEPHELHNACR